MEPEIRIRLFGKFSVHHRQQILLDHTPHKVQELLAYLILHCGKAHPRETLAELLWGDRETSQTRKYLRQALWQLQIGLTGLSARHAPRGCCTSSRGGSSWMWRGRRSSIRSG